MQDLNTIVSFSQLHDLYGFQLPRHVGIILDGNRRWIKQQGMTDITKGHLAGYQTLKRILYPFFDAGIHYLTAYALSTENVRNRKPEEIKFLFKLIIKGVQDVLNEPLIHEKKVRVRLIGRIQELPHEIQEEIQKMNEITKDYSDNFINFCVMYDGQEEIIDAVKSIIDKKIPKEMITAEIIKQNLYSKDFPPVDYIIRTGMEDGARISGFLLWDSSYAEFRFRSELWPDYNENMIMEDLKEYLHRNRRKGA